MVTVHSVADLREKVKSMRRAPSFSPYTSRIVSLKSVALPLAGPTAGVYNCFGIQNTCKRGVPVLRRIIRCLIFYAVLGVLCFPFGRGLARTEFRPDAFPFASYFWEREGRIYARLRIREWQGLLPDVSRLFPGSVPRKELKGGEKPEDRLRLLINESCVAEVTHLVLCVLGLWAVHILPGQGGVTLWLLYVLLGNLPYILIQRYNRPMMMRTLERRCQGRPRLRRQPGRPGMEGDPGTLIQPAPRQPHNSPPVRVLYSSDAPRSRGIGHFSSLLFPPRRV